MILWVLGQRFIGSWHGKDTIYYKSGEFDLTRFSGNTYVSIRLCVSNYRFVVLNIMLQ